MHSPLTNQTQETHKLELTDQWIIQALETTARISMAWTKGIHIQARTRELPTIQWTDMRLPHLLPRIRRPARQDGTVADRILSVLLNGHFRRGPLEHTKPFLPQLLEKIQQAVDHDRAVEIVLPTLPFKSQNPLMFPRKPSDVDLAEWLHFAQLRDLCASVEAVHSPGLHLHLLADGIVYADMFGNGCFAEAEEYRQRVTRMKDKMGLTSVVDIIDMCWLVAEEPSFGDIRKRVRNAIERLESSHPFVRQRMDALSKSMLLNIPIPGMGFDLFAELLDGPEETLAPSITGAAHEAALNYAAFLLTMKKLNVVMRAFPRAIRGTVHPKPEPQLPLHLVNAHSVCFPHNGVPLVSKEKLERTGDLRQSTRIVRFSDALLEPDLVRIHGTDGAFFCFLSSSLEA